MSLKIVKDGNRITYIYTTEKENIPLVSVENFEIRIEKQRIDRIENCDVAFALIAALRHAIRRMREKTEAVYRQCPIERFYWQFVREYEAMEAVEALRHDDGISQSQNSGEET